MCIQSNLGTAESSMSIGCVEIQLDLSIITRT